MVETPPDKSTDRFVKEMESERDFSNFQKNFPDTAMPVHVRDSGSQQLWQKNEQHLSSFIAVCTYTSISVYLQISKLCTSIRSIFQTQVSVAKCFSLNNFQTTQFHSFYQSQNKKVKLASCTNKGNKSSELRGGRQCPNSCWMRLHILMCCPLMLRSNLDRHEAGWGRERHFCQQADSNSPGQRTR